MYIEFTTRFKEGRALIVLIPLLVLHLALLSIQIEDPSGTVLLRKWLVEAATPFLNGSSSASRAVSRAWNSYVWLRGVSQENRRLKNQVHLLNLREQSLSLTAIEIVQLRRLLGIRDNMSFETIGARVVGRAPNYLANILYVDRGSEDGLRPNLPVVSGDGILGRIILVSPHTAQVQLITNSDASVGALVEKTRTPGVLRGRGDEVADLNYLSNTESVGVNDRIVTSGLDGIYPRGLPIGSVTESHKGNSVFRIVRVQPFADLKRVEEVLVITNAPRDRIEIQKSPTGSLPPSK